MVVGETALVAITDEHAAFFSPLHQKGLNFVTGWHRHPSDPRTCMACMVLLLLMPPKRPSILPMWLASSLCLVDFHTPPLDLLATPPSPNSWYSTFIFSSYPLLKLFPVLWHASHLNVPKMKCLTHYLFYNFAFWHIEEQIFYDVSITFTLSSYLNILKLLLDLCKMIPLTLNPSISC